jgi:2-oxoglutarate ferredoxin oxidoreductase subunit alpha
MENFALNILISGEAGQGLQTIGLLFVKGLVRNGYHVHTSQTFESRIRGGYSTFSIRTGNKKILAPSDSVDLIFAFNENHIKKDLEGLSPSGIILGSNEWKIDDNRFVGAPFSTFGEKRYWNIAGLGILSSLMGMGLKEFSKIVQERFESSVAKKNMEALESAFQWAEKQNLSFQKLPAVETMETLWVMDCHESLAFGAVSGGIKFCAFYPMSPSTSIPQTLINHAESLGIVVEQVEDEISALNMAIGASYCGAPALVPTSGGGFALMTEALSLSAATETPVVIVVAQRPGPATGLPTRTEQGDLRLVLGSGHGEFPRAIFAPSNVEDCFHITRHAVDVAERYQIPVILLTDHYLSSSYQDMTPLDVTELPFIQSGQDPSGIESPYLRYRLTDTGVSPRLLPGQSHHLVIADSHEHTEDGHITEDLKFRPKLVEKRLKKEKSLAAEILPPEFSGSSAPDLLLVSWGSSRGAVLEAAEQLQKKQLTVGCLHFCQLWPLNPNHFLPQLKTARRVVGVEGNATGQLCRLIREETGFTIEERISRYDGLALTPEYILKGLGQS